MFSSNTTQTSGGYEIQRSLRFNSADSAYLNRTPASAGNRKTWTWSGWFKRSGLSAGNTLFSAGPTDGAIFRFENADTLRLYDFNSTFSFNLTTTQVFRDPSAWYHVVLAYDSTQATSSDRTKLFVNGSQVTAFATAAYPSLNQDSNWFNNNVIHTLGVLSFSASNYFNGYMTEVNFIDGQALTPSSFGEYNADTGVWQPKRYAGSYGTNGFYLNFSDNSNTTAATLGADYSGNGNNWTPNNFSVSAGAGNDSLVDVPTNWGVDTGVGGSVRGNYATLNPLNAGSTATLSNGNLDMAGTSTSATSIAYSTIGVSTGKWYWEVQLLTGPHMIGIGKDGGLFDWTTTNGYGYFSINGQKYTNGAASAYGASYTNGNIVGVALDMDAGTLTFYKNGVSQGTAFSGLTGTWFPAAQNPGEALTEAFNFGQRPFAYTAPSGFKALNTQNLPTPTIGATPETQAGKFFNPVLYTGDRAFDRNITGVGFQPDWVWVKPRNNADGHYLMNVLSGTGKYLMSDSTASEVTNAQTLTAFNSDGFTVGNTGTTNETGRTYVAWNWKANGAGVTNTAGSITSTVSANTTSGFSVVTYTGTGANATVGHGLGAAPKMVIVKSRSAVQNWVVYNSNLTSSAYVLYLNLTNAESVNNNQFNSTAPTSTVFSVGSSSDTNQTSSTYVAYCFSEVPGYSKFGSYTGNGSTDGPFVFTNMRPAYVMIKRTDTTGNWIVWDTTRNTFNVMGEELYPNLSNAGSTATDLDVLSNGFKLRNTTADFNASGGAYIFMALASSPFKYSLAR